MGQSTARPPSVWITQALLLLASIPLSVGLVGSVLRCWFPLGAERCPSPPNLPDLLAGLAVLGCALVAFRGLQKGQRHGQLLAATLLVGSMIVGVRESPLAGILEAGPHSLTPGGGTLSDPLQTCHPTPGQRGDLCEHAEVLAQAWTLASSLFPPLAVGFLAFRLLFSEAARRFFRTTHH